MNETKEISEFFETSITIKFEGEIAKYMNTLRPMGIKVTPFVREAIIHYMPIYREKIEVWGRYLKATEDYSPNMNEPCKTGGGKID